MRRRSRIVVRAAMTARRRNCAWSEIAEAIRRDRRPRSRRSGCDIRCARLSAASDVSPSRLSIAACHARRRADRCLAPDGIVVVQIEQQQQRAQRQALHDERCDHDRESRQDDEVAVRERRWSAGSASAVAMVMTPRMPGPDDDERLCATRRRAGHAVPASRRCAETRRPMTKIVDPGEPHDEAGRQDREREDEVAAGFSRRETLDQRAQLQTDHREGQHVEQEDDDFPHGIGRQPLARRIARRRGARERDRVGDERQTGRPRSARRSARRKTS